MRVIENEDNKMIVIEEKDDKYREKILRGEFSKDLKKDIDKVISYLNSLCNTIRKVRTNPTILEPEATIMEYLIIILMIIKEMLNRMENLK